MTTPQGEDATHEVKVKTDTRASKVTPLSGFWFMVEPTTQSMAELLYDNLDDDELDELESVRMDRKGFVEEFIKSDRTACFFAGSTLVFACAANWIILDGKCRRLWDTMSTRFVRENGLTASFVKHTQEMIDAFMLGEPTDDVIGICKSDFKRSRKWIERIAHFEKEGEITILKHRHTVYSYHWGKDRGF